MFLRTCDPDVIGSNRDMFDQALRASLQRIITGNGSGIGDFQWRMATLPINAGGLGFYQMAETMQYAFLASRLQTSDLQCHILRFSGVVEMGSRYDAAVNRILPYLGDASTVVLRPSVPKTMKLLAEKFFQHAVKHIEDSMDLSPRQKALIHSLQTPYAQVYLLVVPIQGTGQKIDPRIFRSIIGYRLGIPLFTSNLVCPSCKLERMDEFSDHALHCAAEIGVKHRHDQVRDLVFDLCRCAGVLPRKEVPLHCISEDVGNLRPADILLKCWEQGHDVCMDIIGVSPFVSNGFNNFVPGQAVLRAAQRKVLKYGAKCTANGLGFIPFAFTTFGELCEEAVEFLKRIRLATLSNVAYAKSAPTFLIG